MANENESKNVNELNIPIGDKEFNQLKPAKVKILDVQTMEIKSKKTIGTTLRKIMCICKHPDRQEAIGISSVRYVNQNKIVDSGLFINLDEDSKIRKGSALAIFMTFVKVNTPKELAGKELDTMVDMNGYLTFRAY